MVLTIDGITPSMAIDGDEHLQWGVIVIAETPSSLTVIATTENGFERSIDRRRPRYPSTLLRLVQFHSCNTIDGMDHRWHTTIDGGGGGDDYRCWNTFIINHNRDNG